MMTEKLKSVISQAEKLTPEEQEHLALVWEEERDWEAVSNKPHVCNALKRMALQRSASCRGSGPHLRQTVTI